MKRMHYTILSILLFTVAAVAQQPEIGRIWESQGKRRPANSNRFILEIAGFRTLAPGPKAPNIIVVQDNGGGNSTQVTGKEQANRQECNDEIVSFSWDAIKLWSFPLASLAGGMTAPANCPSINNIGFAHFQSEGNSSQEPPSKHAILAFAWDLDNDDVFDDKENFISIIDPNTNQEVYREQGAKLLGVMERLDGTAAILGFMMKDGKIIGVGAKGGNTSSFNTTLPPASPIAYQTVADYQLELKFQAEPGLQLAYDPELFNPPDDFDLDGDGHSDIAMISEDANGEPQGVIVRNGQTFDILWQFPFPAEHKENILKGFHGFVDANGDGEKEAIFGENLAVTLDGMVHVIAENFITLDVNDVDGDGLEDIIGVNTTDTTIVIYGNPLNPTSVPKIDLVATHFQLSQNYPNPFNPSTTISYSVSEAGEVELTVYNPLGQAVRSLFRGQKSVGEYTLKWDGRDDAGSFVGSGPYFYRLKIGDAIQSRRMLFLK